MNKVISEYVKKTRKRIKNEFNHSYISDVDVRLDITRLTDSKKEVRYYQQGIIGNLDEHIYYTVIIAPFIGDEIFSYGDKLEKYNQQLLSSSEIKTWHPEMPTFGGSSRDLVASKNLYLYVDQINTSIDQVILYFSNFGYKVKLRDKAYREATMKLGKKDVFICHDSRDKEFFVKPLAQGLKDNAVSVWYDEYEIMIGDSLHDKIDDGLKNCKFGIIVLSKNFLSNKGWVDQELKSF